MLRAQLRRLRKAEAPPSLASLSILALGVVFGDIGTSPLYALRACFTTVAGVDLSASNVLGVLSLLFWSLALVISVKYVGIILRADNEGEGGVLALATLVLNERPPASSRRGDRVMLGIAIIGLAGCALFYGDGVITPAVTVLGAIEGLSVITPSFEPYIVPIAVIALLALFKLQKRGTGAIGALFGPLMAVWFVTLAALGARAIALHPEVAAAVNPMHAIDFFMQHSGVAFAVFGAVFLAVTGGEALYTDLGHFGHKPIALAWYVLVWPCLLLNYFGQGALLLSDPGAIANPFYHLAPGWFLVPLVVLATIASIIASQAVISGVFSITQQCQQLGYLPRLKILHSSEEAMGQVYVPTVNWLICAATIGLTVGFGSSGQLANAYGVGVSSTMLIDTTLMLLLLLTRDGRAARVLFAILAALVAVDVAFVLANLHKVPEGGWFPLLFGALVFGVMRTWQRGRDAVTQRMRREEQSVAKFLHALEHQPPVRNPGVAVYLTSNAGTIPRTLVRNLKLNGVLHERAILFTVTTERRPHVRKGGQTRVETIAPGLYRLSARIGFMQIADVPRLLRAAEHQLGFRTDEAVYFLARDEIVIGTRPGMRRWRRYLFLFLARNSQYAAASFNIPPSRLMEIGGQVEI